MFQHELDHLNGKLFIDRISKKNPWLKKQGVKYI
nr:peptide deformylase [Mycoplasmopsis cynos]